MKNNLWLKGIIFSVLIFIFSATVATDAFAADISSLETDFTGENCIILSCDTSASGELIIPEIIDGKEVTVIADDAFYGCTELTSVKLPSTLRTIGNGAFSYCASITEIDVPDSVENLGKAVFSKCYGLKTVSLSHSLSFIPEETFYMCQRLNSVVFPESTLLLGKSAFSGCSSLERVVLPETVTEVFTSCFSSCTALESIYLPRSLTQIGKDAFEKCSSLKEVYYQGSDREFSSVVINTGNEAVAPGRMIFDHNHKQAAEKTVVSPTCTKTGYTLYNCPCGFDSIDDFAESEGHQLVDFIKIYEADCVNEGLAYLKCKNCSFYEEITLSVRQHTPVVDPAVKADCIKTGLTEGSHCSECGKVLVEQKTVPLSEHKFTRKISDNQHLASEPSYTVPARYYYTCAVCDAIDKNKVYNGDTLKLGKTNKFISSSTNNTITLGWNKVKGATGYIIYYKNSAGKWKAYKKLSSNILKISKIPSGRTYEFAVKAYVVENNKTVEAPVYATLKEATKPLAPSKIVTVQNEKAIKLTWSASAGATHYQLYYYNTAKKKWIIIKKDIKGCSYIVSNLKAGTSIRFAVKPYINVGSKNVFCSSYTTISTSTSPKPPTLKATPLKGAARLNWSKVSGADGYIIYGSSNMNSGYKRLTTTTALTYTKSGLTSGKPYYFRAYSYKKTPSGVVYSCAGTVKSVAIK